MNRLLFEAPVWPSLEATNGLRIPIGRIFCVGRNYAAHAVEMGVEVDREAPFWFLKSAHALLAGGALAYPPGTKDFQHEVELAVILGAGGASVPASGALSLVFGYAAGLDMTRRDLQQAARAAGRPWDTGKDFEGSAVVGPVSEAARIGHPQKGRIALAVNGEVRQRADISDLVWKVPELIAHLSTLYRLRPGDLLMTGTPAGVGPVVPGDRLVGEVAGVGEVSLAIGERVP